MIKNYPLILLFCIGFQVSNAQIAFADRATALGMSHSAGTTFLGNGISFFDYNNDGWDDVTMCSETGTALKFFKNVNGTFVEEVLITPAITYNTKQVNWVDIDNDGDKDLFVTSDTDGNRLFENTGSMTLVDITTTAGIPTGNLYTYGASWGDYNNDGFLDVYISNRDEVGFSTPNYLYRNNGDHTFTDVSTTVGLNTDAHSSFCSAFFDMDNDGDQDLFVANDRNIYPNFLYKNNGDGTFTDISASSGAGIYMDAMSATIGDYNHDGWMDIYITNTFEGNVFLRNNGNETFQDVATSTGTEFNAIGWGSLFFDAENDMDLDIYVSGKLDGNPSLIPYAFYENHNDGTFSEPSPTGFESDNSSSYANATGDFNNDGLFDIVVSNDFDDNMFLWENQTTTTNNYLKIKLEGTVSNRDGIGSVIEIGIGANKQYRYTLCGEGYLSQNSSNEIFGLGSHTMVDYIKVTWLSGIVDYFYNVNANQLFNITEGNGTLSILNYPKSGLKIYPNPAENMLNIKSPERINSVEIFNSLGQNLGDFDYDQNELKLNVSHLKPGTYFFKIESRNITHTHKIIIN
ncbi:MAG: T9SS type A sorting domain-containing protein [Flavobacteriaceae bacterium]|nr:MAG: T9SS type A sorting domain-containing protein [Flavobacteriaceae bacterium]